MSNYIGVKCPVCGKKFTQADDIVVCPVCGAPHHRDCYARENACAFAGDHLSGKEWRPPPPDPAPPGPDGTSSWNKARTDNWNGGETVLCDMCKSTNPKDAIFCQVCGARMGFGSGSFWSAQYNADPISIVYGGLNPDHRIEDETARDLAVYVGQNSSYYLPKFKVFSETSRTVSFNFPAMFFGFFYFFYRKMYLAGSILLVLFIISTLPTAMLLFEDPQQILDTLPPFMSHHLAMGPGAPPNQEKINFYQQLANVTGTIDFVIRIGLSFCATRLYYIKTIGDVKHIRETQPEPHDEIAYCDRLRDKGGTNKIAVIVLISAYFALSTIVATYVTYKFL